MCFFPLDVVNFEMNDFNRSGVSPVHLTMIEQFP